MNWIKNNRLIAGILGLGIILVLGFFIFGRNTGNQEIVTADHRDVVESVRIAGTVEARIVSDLGFETSGIVRNVAVDVNDTVYRGQTLVSLGLGTLSAELQSAQASLAIKRAEHANTSVNLDAIREKQDTLVVNAYSELLSSGLVAEPQSVSYTQTPPVISGRYVGKEGRYKLSVKSALQSGDSDLYVFDMEDVEPVEISKTGSTPLGTRGLFVSFPDDVSAYEHTTWYVDIPNTKSASYATAYSAYQDALRERNRAIDEAEAEVRDQTTGASIADAELAQAEAEVARIQALIGQRILTAPFDGTVASVSVDPGESVNANDPVVSIISNDGFGVEVDLPEVDSVKVRVGNPVSITLDALGDEVFAGTVVSVSRSETLVDGVSVYEARIAFDNADERISSGMTADVSIETSKRSDVLALPARAVKYREDGTPYVLRRESDGGGTVEQEIVLGLRGSDGFIEVTAGISRGDELVISE